MKLKEFFENVNADSDMEGLAIEDGVFFVGAAEYKLKTSIPIDAVLSCDWKTLRDIIQGRRSAMPLHHMSRVVGYYSRVENWNQSKIGELKDRLKGNYTIEKNEKPKNAKREK